MVIILLAPLFIECRTIYNRVLISYVKHIQQIIYIPTRTTCAPLLYSYDADIIQNIFKDKMITESKAFNLTFKSIDDALSINNQKLANWIHSIYHKELEIKEKTETSSFALFLDIYLQFVTISSLQL
jgi:hypothetical protein